MGAGSSRAAGVVSVRYGPVPGARLSCHDCKLFSAEFFSAEFFVGQLVNKLVDAPVKHCESMADAPSQCTGRE